MGETWPEIEFSGVGLKRISFLIPVAGHEVPVLAIFGQRKASVTHQSGALYTSCTVVVRIIRGTESMNRTHQTRTRIRRQLHQRPSLQASGFRTWRRGVRGLYAGQVLARRRWRLDARHPPTCLGGDPLERAWTAP